VSAGAIDALRAEQQRALDLFVSLSADEWQLASGCAGWRVQDVAQHMASVFHSIADPSTIEGGTSDDVEQNAEVPVQARRSWTSAQVLAEYREWADKGIATLEMMQAPPLADTVIALSNLGEHPMHILGNAIVFDHYCHLRHDIGAAIERAAQLPRDPAALRATVEWMLAGVPQMCAAALTGCTQGVNLVFSDVADDGYHLAPGNPLWTVSPGVDASLPTVSSSVHDFISWGTKRADWRSLGVQCDGHAADTLDALNVI
jgi:uncharacterized protein (TIGR03083 family)